MSVVRRWLGGDPSAEPVAVWAAIVLDGPRAAALGLAIPLACGMPAEIVHGRVAGSRRSRPQAGRGCGGNPEASRHASRASARAPITPLVGTGTLRLATCAGRARLCGGQRNEPG